jgi:hypothetical protein
MRPLLALAILLIGLKSAMPETKYQDSLLDVGVSPAASSFALAAPIGKSDRTLVVALPPVEASDAAHHQEEEAAAPPQPPAPASTDTEADAAIADSLDDLCNALMTSAQDNGLPVPFFANLIWQESRMRNDAVSRVGAVGIAQFMPQVAIAEGVGDPFDPHQAIPASARLLHTLRGHFGNLGLAAAAYNAGPHRVGEWLDHRRALPRETRTYVLRVTGRSVEAWRKSPLDDAKLTFVRRLPCRALPAFADLEQQLAAQAQRQAQQAELPQEPPTPRPRKVVTVMQKIAAKIAGKAVQKVANAASVKVAHKTGKTAPTARTVIAARKQPHGVAHPATVARNFRGRHDDARRLHAPHEKRRVA